MQSEKLTRITYVAGYVGALSVALGSLLSALVYRGSMGQRYSMLNHFVSELGEVAVSQWALAFNVGVFIGGLGLAVFIIGLALSLRGWFRWVLLVMGLVTGLSGMLVGVFPMDNFAAHLVVAQTFFNTGWITTGLFSLYVWFGKDHIYPRWVVLPSIVTVLSFLAFLNLTDGIAVDSAESLAYLLGEGRPDVWMTAILEWLVIVCILAWALIVADVVRRRSDQAL